jgi:methanogenic corrinoid protein MtbC1
MAPEGSMPRPDLLAELQRVFTDALLRAERDAAEDTLREAVDAGVDEATIDDMVIAPAMRIVGDLWQTGELSVGEEHLATSIAMQCVTLHRERFRVARRRRGRTVVLGAVEGEQHIVGLEMAASLLSHAGYEVKDLGANVPSHALGIVIDRHPPSVVALSVTMPGFAPELYEAIGMVRAVRPRSGVIIGGAGVPNSLMDDPVVRRCERLSDAVALADALAQASAFN